MAYYFAVYITSGKLINFHETYRIVFFFNETEVMQPIVGNSLLLDWTTLNITKKRNENITLK